MRHSPIALLAVLATGLFLALPATAGATTVIYIDGGNVWTARVDGSHKRQFTTDGTKDKPPFDANSPRSAFVGAYSNVSADDQGRVLMARQFRDENAQSDRPFWIWADATGKLLGTPPIVQMTYCGFPSVGPLGARLHPSGDWFVFWYICNYGSPSWGSEVMTQVNTPGSLLKGPEWSGYYQPSWYGNRITASNQADGGIQADDPRAPAVPSLSFDLWIQHQGNDRVTRVDPARSGGRAMVTHYDTTDPTIQDRLTFVTFSGAPAPGGTAEGCTIPTEGKTVSSPSWSADGKYVAWSDDGGVKTAAVPANLASPGACDMTPTVISATGGQPALTPHDWVSMPTATTSAASDVSAGSATLHGTVNPTGEASTYRFDYGTSTAYGSATTERSAGSDLADHSVSATITGLKPNTTYHFRIAAKNAAGTAYGSDSTFVTRGSGPSTQPTPSVPGAVTTAGSTLKLKFGCRGTSSQTCRGQVVATAIEKLSPNGRRIIGVVAAAPRNGRTRVVQVAKGSLSARGGRTAAVSVSLNATGRVLLSRFKKLPATIKVTGGGRTLRTVKVTFRAAKARGHLLGQAYGELFTG